MEWNPNTSWVEDAACKGMDTNIFFPERGDKDGNIAKARATCKKCPVRQDCLDRALEFEIDNFGIFGGYTATQRRGIRRLLKQHPGTPFFQIVGVEKIKFTR